MTFETYQSAIEKETFESLNLRGQLCMNLMKRQRELKTKKCQESSTYLISVSNGLINGDPLIVCVFTI